MGGLKGTGCESPQGATKGLRANHPISMIRVAGLEVKLIRLHGPTVKVPTVARLAVAEVLPR
jgi:hypothetical protein